MKKYSISKEQAAEIRAVIKSYEKTSAFRRLQAVMLMGEGKKVEEVASTTFYHPNWVYELVKEFCVVGFDEFVKEKRGGANHRNLSEKEEAEIVDKFKEKATQGQVVVVDEIKAEYEEKLGREVPNSTFYGFLHRMEWRRVMPRGAHPKKASEEVIDSSKKLTLESKN